MRLLVKDLLRKTLHNKVLQADGKPSPRYAHLAIYHNDPNQLEENWTICLTGPNSMSTLGANLSQGSTFSLFNWTIRPLYKLRRFSCAIQYELIE